jgi:hypothetical protein
MESEIELAKMKAAMKLWVKMQMIIPKHNPISNQIELQYSGLDMNSCLIMIEGMFSQASSLKGNLSQETVVRLLGDL